jgi:hypothetical protein
MAGVLELSDQEFKATMIKRLRILLACTRPWVRFSAMAEKKEEILKDKADTTKNGGTV